MESDANIRNPAMQCPDGVFQIEIRHVFPSPDFLRQRRLAALTWAEDRRHRIPLQSVIDQTKQFSPFYNS